MIKSMRSTASPRLWCCHDRWTDSEPVAGGDIAWLGWWEEQPPVTTPECPVCTGGVPVEADLGARADD